MNLCEDIVERKQGVFIYGLQIMNRCEDIVEIAQRTMKLSCEDIVERIQRAL